MNELPRGHILLDDLATDRRFHGNFKRWWSLYEFVGIRNSHHLQCSLRRCQVAARLYLSRLCLFHVLLGNRFVLIQITGARIGFLCQSVGFLGFQIIGAELRIIRARHVQHGLAFAHVLTGHHHHPADRSAHLRDNGRRAKTVVSHRPRQPEGSGQRRGLNRQHLDMRHLLLGDGKQFCVVRTLGAIRIGGGLRPGISTAGKHQHDRRRGSECSHPSTAIGANVHGRFLMAGSSILPLPSIARARSYKRPTPGDRPIPQHGSCARHPENPGDWRRRACKHTH